MQSAEILSTVRSEEQELRFNLKVELDDKRPVYISGNFNDWQLRDSRFKLKKITRGEYELSWPQSVEVPNTIEYKYLKGGWDAVELDRYGNRIENRTIARTHGEICDFVPRWRIKGLAYNKKYFPLHDLIRDDYEIPQMGKTRRICALLPHDYEESDKHYPVLYMNDGQNLFDESAPFGNWAVDQKMAILAEYGLKDLIVVTIDHGEKDRLTEYSPFFNWRWGKGQGRQYLEFVTQTLKPYIDSHYRTLPEAKNTGIGGSSMGGLISLYSGLKYPHIFGKLMVFSPSLWITPKIFLKAINSDHNHPMDVYLYAGGGESATMLSHVDKLKSALKNHPEIAVRTSIDPHGQHNEFKWGQEFPKAVEWLYFIK